MAEKLDSFDIAALEKSVNDSAVRVSTIWVSYLVFGLYLVIAAGNVTHRQLFLEEPVKLPVLNIDLPFVGFFFLAPILFVILHAYVLIQVLLLARTADAYNDALKRRELVGSAEARVRQRLANTLFAQIFAGSPREREGLLGRVLRLMALLTLAIAPAFVLLVFQYKFLPYHSQIMTWTHRVLIGLNLTTVLLLWRGVIDARHDITWRGLLEHKIVLPGAVGLLLFSITALSFPGEPHANWTRYVGTFSDPVGCRAGSPISWILSRNFDRLSLPEPGVVYTTPLINLERLGKTTAPHVDEVNVTLSFRHRDLRCSELIGVDLRRADFSYARMSGASLAGDFRGAIFYAAQLQRAVVSGTQLHGANLVGAQLQGAVLRGAQLQGANLSSAQLQGATFLEPQLQGAVLGNARLDGALLNEALLQGADIRQAYLPAARLHRAQLQGAYFIGKQLNAAEISNAFLWQTTAPDCVDAQVRKSEFGAYIVARFDFNLLVDRTEATSTAVERFIEDSTSRLLQPEKGRLQTLLRHRLVADRNEDETRKNETAWRSCEESALSNDEYTRKIAAVLGELVCKMRADQKSIVEGIERNWLSDASLNASLIPALARHVVGPDGKLCAGAEFDKRMRKRLSEPVARYPAKRCGDAPPRSARCLNHRVR